MTLVPVRNAHTRGPLVTAKQERGLPAEDSHLLIEGWREAWCRAGHVDLHVIEAGRRGDPLVILLHGFPEFWWAWRHQIGPLADAGFHVIAPDMRGYNLSERPAVVADYRLDRLLADVLALADAFQAPQFALVGHDWGGLVAWAVAAAHPDRLRKLVVLNAPHPARVGAYMIRHPSQVLRSAYMGIFQLPAVPELILSSNGFHVLKRSMRASARRGTFSETDLATYTRAWARPGALKAMINYYRALRLNRSPQWDRVRTPTLLLWGARDRFLERGLADESLGLCDRGNIHLFPRASHWLHLEEPQAINAAITAFLTEPGTVTIRDAPAASTRHRG